LEIAILAKRVSGRSTNVFVSTVSVRCFNLPPLPIELGNIVSEITEGLGEVAPNTSILFLGSGFSLGAKNIAGGEPPNGSELRRLFIRKLNLPADTSYDLQVLTEEFASDNTQKLVVAANLHNQLR
jgi:hypothetical protein